MPSISAEIATKASGFSSSRLWLWGLKLAVTVAIVVWLSYYLQSQLIFELLGRVNPVAVIAALALLPVNLGLQWCKWHYLLQRTRPDCSWQSSLSSLLAGFPIGLITPGRWGELGRAFFLSGCNKAEVVFLAAVDKIYNLLVNALTGSLALNYLVVMGFLPESWRWPLRLLLIAAIALNLAGLWPALIRRLALRARRFWPKRIPAFQAGAEFSLKYLASVWSLSFLFVLTYCFQLVLLIRGFAKFAVVDGLAGSAATFFVKSALPIALGDLGVREGAAAYFFNRLGVMPQAAFNAGLLLFTINLFIPSLVGLVLIWRHNSECRQ